MNWLYNRFVAAVTRGVGLPQKLTKGTLTLVVTAFFFINWRQFRGRLCPICKTLRKLQLFHRFPLFLCGKKNSPSSRMISYTCLIPFPCQSRQRKGLSWIVIYLLSQIFWIYTISAVGTLTSCNSDQYWSVSSLNLWSMISDGPLLHRK